MPAMPPKTASAMASGRKVSLAMATRSSTWT